MKTKKKKLVKPYSLQLHIEQMQQGGVYTPGVMPYDVVPVNPNTPGMNIPIPGIKNAVDPSALIFRQQALNQRQDALDLRQQQMSDRALATSQANFLDLQDKLYGDVHNPYQEEQLAKLKKEHNIPENITSDIFQNQYRLKDLEFSMSQSLADQRFKNVMGEVGTVNKMRDSAYKTLTEDEYRAWAEEYDKYQFSTDGKYDINKLAPSLYQKEKAPKETDYASWLDSPPNREYLAGIDPQNQASLDEYYDNLAGEFAAKGTKEALDRGYLEYIDPANPDYGVVLSDKGKQLALDKAEKARFIKAGKFDEYVAKRRLGQTITQENRAYSDKLSDQNRAESAAEDKASGSSPGSSGRKETETEKEARLELQKIETKYYPSDSKEKLDVSQKLPNGLTIKDAMWKAVKDGNVSVVAAEIEKFLQDKGKVPGKKIEVPDILQFPGSRSTSGAQELIKGQ